MTSRTSPFTRLRYSAAAVLAASALVLTACNDGGNPPGNDPTSPSASESASASATSSPTPTPSAAYKPADAKGKAQNVPVPVLPEAAKAETKEGLEAFAKYWYSTLSYAYETGELTPMNQISGEGCLNCEEATKVIANWNSDGRWLEGGKVTTPAIETTFKVAPDGNYQVVVQVQQSEIRAYKSDGSRSDSVIPPSDVAQIFMAKWSLDHWQLVDVQRLNG
ncbi:DUF6318 family protein [Arthrobacter sp. ISL-69]|uniref:DUF6318 family protein n=1 Tax=Arthrobacter sp. ISL-69 TaxID=2819113 RepID=UPI001BEB3334|nr:DUF6318 family protein [Arthrobacter sp. ISL-69]MBT2535298.1 hypothetical protein [Arthrobacter sp. ISL-69]